MEPYFSEVVNNEAISPEYDTIGEFLNIYSSVVMNPSQEYKLWES